MKIQNVPLSGWNPTWDHLLTALPEKKSFCLHMRWTSKVVNQRVVVFPGGFSRGKTTSRGLTWFSWFSPHMKAIHVLLYWNYTKMFITWIFCFAEDNKIIYGKENTITKLEKKINSTHFWLLGVVDWATTYCLPLHYICLGCPPRCFPHHQMRCFPHHQFFRKTSTFSY
jgi:hypothetical protein